jgi:peptidyl-tRNA hydrolase
MSLLNWNSYNEVPHYLRDEEEPYSLPLILHLEKDTSLQPSHEEALIASAKAIIALFDDERSEEGKEWFPYLDKWMHGRIRKVARRARASAWDNVQNLDGVTVSYGKAEVRVLLPHPLDNPPIEVKKLQVSGLDLPKTSNSLENDSKNALALSINPDVSMSTGKSMAQIGHATQLAIFNTDEEKLSQWALSDRKVVLADWNSQDKWDAEIQDAGFTEVAPGSVTARGMITTQ